MTTSNNDQGGEKVSEAPAPYGQLRRMVGKPISVSKEEMKKMDPPFPAEPEWVAELSAEAECKPKRMAGKRIVVTEEERLHMPPPCPAEPEWIAELDAEADRREALRKKQY